MADDESNLAAEIARLEAELERARIESKLQHLKAELNAVEGGDEFLVIQDLADSGRDENENDMDYSYEEFDDEDYIEEIIEEEYSEEEIIEEEYEEEYEVEEVVSEPAAPPRYVYGNIQSALGNLRKAPVSTYQKKETNAVEDKAVVAAAPQPIPPAPPTSMETTKPVPKPIPKGPVRPPPSQGGEPVPRQDISEAAKSERKFPLSRLLQRNKKSVDVTTGGTSTESSTETPPPISTAPKKRVPTKKATASAAASTKVVTCAANAKGGGPFKRRVIPNLQPSSKGQESIFEQLLGPKLITNPQLHKCSTKGCVKSQELVGLYFGAMWKSDCKRFNPMLKDFYYSTAVASSLEIIYISADRSLIEFKDCYASMPFLAMPAGTTNIKNELTKALKIIEMPALVILDDEGSIVTVQGAQKIMELEKGNVEQANQLVERWKKTRPIPIADVKMDNTLLHGTMERGAVYWQN